MPTWKLLIIVALAGLGGSLLRGFANRLFARPLRRRRTAPRSLRTACSLGIPEGNRLQVWVARGQLLPVSCRRMVRAHSRGGPVLPLSFHTDEDDLSPLVEVEIGPIDRSKQNVRLVEVLLNFRPTGLYRVHATARSWKTCLQGLPACMYIQPR